MKKIASIFAIAAVFLLTGVQVHAETVLTIYFAGTTITEDWYQKDKSDFKQPELVSTLYHEDTGENVYLDYPEEGPPLSLEWKVFVDGVGTRGAWWNLLDPEAKWPYPFVNRGFDECLAEAENALELFRLYKPYSNVVLNLVGFSRGGVLTMKMARSVTDMNLTWVKKINILALDPVPLYAETPFHDTINKLGSDAELSSLVNQYVGIYAEDEMSYGYEPVIPKYSEPTKVWLASIPGGHETLVGSRDIDGHTLPFKDLLEQDNNLRYVSEVAKAIAKELLGSPEWGQVRFTENWYGPDDDKSELFSNLVDSMYAYPDYEKIREHVFLATWSTFDIPYSRLGRDHQLLASAGILAALFIEKVRLCYKAPYRHAAEWAWVPTNVWPYLPLLVWFPNPDQVYGLGELTKRIDASDYDLIQTFGNYVDSYDEDPPVPSVDPLPTLTGDCAVEITLRPLAFDEISGTIPGETNNPLYYDEQGTYQITWTYYDRYENSATQTQDVIVDDLSPPVPDQETLPDAVGQCSAAITETPTATDNCSGLIAGTTTDPLEYTEPGTHTVFWIYTDSSGSESTQTQTVVVEGLQPVDDLAARAKSDKVQLTWTHAEADSYNVYRKTAGSNYELLANTTSSYCTYLDADVTNGTTYYYQVSSICDGTESGVSNDVSATPQARRRR